MKDEDFIMQVRRLGRLCLPWTGLVVILMCIGIWPPAAGCGENVPLSTLKVALLPILDTFPYHVARQKGYFSALGLDAVAVPAGSGLERDQLMQAGAVDGMLNEMTSTASFNRERPQVVIVAAARKATAEYPLFRVLAAPGSGLRRPSDLVGVPIGVSRNTIIEYVTDRLLQASGIELSAITKKSVPVIPERYQLLLQGRLKAATLPDPLAKSALTAGAIDILDDTRFPVFSISVLTFSKTTLKNKPRAVKAFLAAWDRAAADINAAPENYRQLLLKSIRVPENIQRTYSIPPFARGEVPSRNQWDDMMAWMVAKALLPTPLPYASSISTAYLPKTK
jgi:NitT/TauT family transport system substrate-binding protein